MADRLWNQIDARLYDEWRLSKEARALLAFVVAICPNQYGIYDPSPFGKVLDWWQGVFSADRIQIEAAWHQLIESAVCIEFRGRNCLWLKKKFKRELGSIKTENHRKGVLNTLDRYPEIKDAFMQLYGIVVSANGIQIAGKPIQIELADGISGFDQPIEISESESELNPPLTPPCGGSASADAPAPPGDPTPQQADQPASKGRSRKPEPEQWVTLACTLDEYIREMIEKHNIAHGIVRNDPQRCAKVLRLLTEEDGFPIALINDLLAWVWQVTLDSGQPYGSVLMSIANWRQSNRNGEKKIFHALESYKARKGARSTAQREVFAHGD